MAEPKYDLIAVKKAASDLNITLRGPTVQRDIFNLDFELEDVALCLVHLSESDYRKTILYATGLPDDEYICEFIKPGNEEYEPDRLYIKYCLIDDGHRIDLASFHLARF
jgi:hypothetical protein